MLCVNYDQRDNPREHNADRYSPQYDRSLKTHVLFTPFLWRQRHHLEVFRARLS